MSAISVSCRGPWTYIRNDTRKLRANPDFALPESLDPTGECLRFEGRQRAGRWQSTPTGTPKYGVHSIDGGARPP